MDYIVPHVEELMLDSGAFSYMNALKNGSKLKNPDWNSYADEYCDYINDYGIDKFLELDLGVLMPYSDVLTLRQRIEKRTNKQVIPVWHEYLGLEEYKNMLDEYHYVAVGGIVTKEIVTSVDLLCDMAHEHGNIVHGLGYTPVKRILDHTLPFDSVDSSAWTSGLRFGGCYCVEENKITRSRSDTRAFVSAGGGVTNHSVLYNDFLVWKNISINYAT